MVQAEPRSVLHVSNMVHIPYEMTRILRRSGWRADYLAVSANPHWSASDLQLVPTGLPRDALREFAFFWRVMARYEVVHLHFMITMSRSGWELPVLRQVPAPAAVLVRPDGYVAWVGEGTTAGLAGALARWFGPRAR